MATIDMTDSAARLRALEEEYRRDLDHAREQLNEIQLLLQQSNSEAEKLGQREATITTRVRDMEINLENYTRNDIKTLYTTAHEVGLRLFMMRSQVEQLQMRHQQVKERQDLLSTMVRILTSGLVTGEGEHATSTASGGSKKIDHDAVSGLGRLIESQEVERQRVSRYLHDGPAQTIANLVLKAEICEHLIERDTNEAKSELNGLRGDLTTTLQAMRRLIFDLRPMLLDDIGVVPTLRRYLAEVGRANGFAPTVRGPESVDHYAPHVRALIFRLVQEVVASLINRGPLEWIVVDLDFQDDHLEITIEAEATGEHPRPDMDAVVAESHVTHRLFLLAATSSVSAIGDRGCQLVVQAVPPAA